MDSIDPHSTPTNHPSFPLSATHALISSHSPQPGMGLPFELWDHIVGFLESYPYTLLSCCLACKSFLKHAEERLRTLSYPTIHLNNLAAFNLFVEEIRTIPGRARPIQQLALDSNDAFPLAFSLVPLRLAAKLVNLRTLKIQFIDQAPNVPSSTWSIYGRAFPNVVYLNLLAVNFPSFLDFVRFATSFRALERLDLWNMSCAHLRVLPSALWSPRKLYSLEQLHLRVLLDYRDPFLGQFVQWFPSRRSVVQHLGIDQVILSHPSALLLLESTYGHLQQLTLHLQFFRPTEEGSRKVWQTFVSEWHSRISYVFC